MSCVSANCWTLRLASLNTICCLRSNPLILQTRAKRYHCRLQVNSPQPMVSPSALLQHVSSTSQGAASATSPGQPWPQDTMQALLAVILKVRQRLCLPRANTSVECSGCKLRPAGLPLSAVLYLHAGDVESHPDILQVMRAVPKASRALLESASAIIAAAPSRFKVGVCLCATLSMTALLA